jgi:hypothetical protein
MNLTTIGATSLDNLDRLPFPTQLRVVREIAKRIGITIPPLRGSNHSFGAMGRKRYEIWIDGLGDGGPVWGQDADSTTECRVGYIRALIGTVRLEQALAGYHFDA